MIPQKNQSFTQYIEYDYSGSYVTFVTFVTNFFAFFLAKTLEKVYICNRK